MIREGNPVWPRLSHYPDPSRRPAPRGPCPLRMTILRRTPDPNRSPSERTHLPQSVRSILPRTGRSKNSDDALVEIHLRGCEQLHKSAPHGLQPVAFEGWCTEYSGELGFQQRNAQAHDGQDQGKH